MRFAVLMASVYSKGPSVSRTMVLTTRDASRLTLDMGSLSFMSARAFFTVSSAAEYSR